MSTKARAANTYHQNKATSPSQRVATGRHTRGNDKATTKSILRTIARRNEGRWDGTSIVKGKSDVRVQIS
jgi:hypothetical protein